MTQIDFYVIDSDSLDDRYLFVARLAEKIYRKQLNIYIHTEQQQSQQQIDELLWNVSAVSFIPHQCWSSQQDSEDQSIICPIYIGVAEPSNDNLPAPYDVLINLCDDIPTFFSRYQRVLEVVSLDNLTRTTSRMHYKFYRDRGYPLKMHDLRRNKMHASI